MPTQYYTSIVFGTGENLITTDSAGLLHEFFMALTNTKIDGLPDHPLKLDQTIVQKSSQRDLFHPVVDAFKIVEPILDDSSRIIVPAASDYDGCYFKGQNLLIINGPTSSKIANALEDQPLPFVETKRISKEVTDKAEATARLLFYQITEHLRKKPDDNIKIFMTGFSRGGCITIIAINMLDALLEEHRSADKVKISVILLDPVPGSTVVDESIHAHVIPKIVSKLDIVYSEHEQRLGFLPLRQFYLENSNLTKVSTMHLPGNHGDIKRLAVGVEGVNPSSISPAQVATHVLEQSYNEQNPLLPNIDLPILTKKSTAEFERLLLKKELEVDITQAQRKQFIQNGALGVYKSYSVLSPVLTQHRKLTANIMLHTAYVEWPSRLKELERLLVSEKDDLPSKVNYSDLIKQLQLLLRHGFKANSDHNSKLIYNNFGGIINDLEDVIKNNQPDKLNDIKIKLAFIQKNAKHDSVIKRIIASALSILAIIITAGIAAPFVYQYIGIRSNTNYHTNDALRIANKIK